MLTVWHIASVCLVALLSFGNGAISSQPPPPTPSKDSQQKKAHSTKTNNKSPNDPAGTDEKPFVIKSIEAEKTTERTEQDRPEREEKSANERSLVAWTIVLAIATIALASIAGIQVGMFWKQLKLMKKGVDDGALMAKTAREAFIATHRPKLIVRRFATQDRGGDEHSVDMACELVNIGESLATVVWLSVRMWNHPTSLPLPGDPPYSPAVAHSLLITNGTLVQLPSLRVEGFHFDSGWQEETGEKGSWLILGYAEYKDINEKIRRTAFLRRYNPQANSFDIIPHPDYEYQD